MCLIVFDWQPDASDDLLTLSANRDEFFRRDAEPMHWWTDAPHVLAGRDLTGGGTWLGLSCDGRCAALTNYRAPSEMRADAPTRGALVSAYLAGERIVPMDYLRAVAKDGHRYNGFNLLAGDFTRRELAWYGNRADAPPALLDAGVHGLSNSLLNTPWPKLVAQREALRDLLRVGRQPSLDTLIDTLRDPRIADDDLLSDGHLDRTRARAVGCVHRDARVRHAQHNGIARRGERAGLARAGEGAQRRRRLASDRTAGALRACVRVRYRASFGLSFSVS